MDAQILKIFYFEKKGQVFAVQAMKAYRGSRVIAPLILNLGIRWR